jgi:hypothetical protein
MVHLSVQSMIPQGLFPLKGPVSRDDFYSTFFFNHILLVLQDVLYDDFKFCRIFAVLFSHKGTLPVLATPMSLESLCSLGRGVRTHRCRLHR